MALFTSMALKGTHDPYKYLGVLMNDTEKQGYLEYSTDHVLSENAKFAVENAHSGLVHIRSCRTNKYWVRSSTDGYWIVAKARQPLDDASAWNSTLFRMDLIGNDNKATFYHVQSETTLRILDDGSDRKMLLSIDPSANTQAVSTAIDLDNIKQLPQYVAFKADNGLFYDYTTSGFTCDDPCNASAMNEIVTDEDGFIKIHKKGDEKKTFGLFSDVPLFSSIPGSGPYPSLSFEVVMVRDGVIALRNLGNNKFCQRRTQDDFGKDLMDISATSFVREAQFQVVECVLRRKVQVLEFDLDNSRIYNVTPISSDTHYYNNPTNQEQEASMNLSITTTQTATWNNSFSIKFGGETSFETGVPFIAEGKITISAEGTYEHQFGGSTEEVHQVGDTYTVKVPPMKRVTARGMATKGTCDVPFSYVQVDHLSDGNTFRRTLSDGVFTGVNAYHFDHDVQYEDVPQD